MKIKGSAKIQSVELKFVDYNISKKNSITYITGACKNFGVYKVNESPMTDLIKLT